jgi:hypothetical protein
LLGDELQLSLCRLEDIGVFAYCVHMEQRTPAKSTPNTDNPNERLYRRIRASFIKKGGSLNSWCEKNGIRRQNARDCLLGKWKGPRAVNLLRRLREAAEDR